MNTREAAQLGEIANFIRGITFKPDDIVPLDRVGAVAVMRTKNVQSTLDVSDVWGISESFVKRKEQFLQEGDILVSSANSWDLVGKCCWIPSLPWRASFGGFVSVLRGDPRSADARYLYHWFRWNPTQTKVRSFGRQTTNISNLSINRCLKMKIPLPPRSEQRRIAKILDKVEALRTKCRAALAQLDELAHSIFLEMFGERAVEESAMSSVAGVASQIPGSIRTGPFGSQLLHSEFTDSGIAVLGIDNAVNNEFRWGERRYISERKYQQLERYTVHPGDILITIMGTCGRCAIVPNDIPLAINTKHLCCITLHTSKCLPVFLHAYFLQHPIVRRYLTRKAKGAIMSGLNMDIIKDLPVPLVPIGDQQEFARRIEAIEALKSQHRTVLEQFDELFASLQQRAFRGEL